MPTTVYSGFATADVSLVTTAETVVATVTVPSTPNPGATVTIEGHCQLTVGTGTTALTPRIRRGGLTGALVGEGNALGVSGAAGSTEEVDLTVDDQPGEVVNQVYVLTVAQTGATANGTDVQSEIEATVRW